MSGRLAAVRMAARWVLQRTARNVSRESATRSLLVIAPHPDDETLGCGVRLAQATAVGTSVRVLVLSRGEAGQDSGGSGPDLQAVREGELREAMRELGIVEGRYEMWNYPDGKLADHVDEMADRLRDAIDRDLPDDVYVTCLRDAHPDHAAASLAARRAVNASGGHARLLEYPVWLWTEWPLSRRYADGSGLRELVTIVLGRRAEVVSAGRVLGTKLAALDAYRSQQRGSIGDGLPPAILRNAGDRLELALVVADRDGVS